jgi:osmoprotectant transport system permease protein
VILAIVGIVQTIPSLALLVFLIPFLGIGGLPAMVALFLYSLLPIVRNTYAGLHDIPIQIRESAEALGLRAAARLRLVELPMAARAILAGIKTSAVINVGTATLGALIGAGGYGQPILTGIRLDDLGLILEGAVPAAVLALLVQGLFELAERWLVPRGLRLKGE